MNEQDIEIQNVQGDITKGLDYFERGYYDLNPPKSLFTILEWIGIAIALFFLLAALRFVALILRF